MGVTGLECFEDRLRLQFAEKSAESDRFKLQT